jgi:hypothetical protein
LIENFKIKCWKSVWITGRNCRHTTKVRLKGYYCVVLCVDLSRPRSLNDVSRSNRNTKLWSVLVSISNLNKILSSRSFRHKYTKKTACLRPSKALKQHFNALVEMYLLSFKANFKLIFGGQKLFFFFVHSDVRIKRNGSFRYRNELKVRSQKWIGFMHVDITSQEFWVLSAKWENAPCQNDEKDKMAWKWVFLEAWVPYSLYRTLRCSACAYGALASVLYTRLLDNSFLCSLKGPCHEIFDLWFFSSNNPISAHDSRVKAF